MQPALGRPGSCSSKLSAVTVAWRTLAAWLVDILGGFGEQVPRQAEQRAARSRWSVLHHSWLGLGSNRHAVAFRQWAGSITWTQLSDRGIVNWLRATTAVVASRATDHDASRARAAWVSWTAEGPAKSIGRLHRMSRVASGWVPSQVGGCLDRPCLSDESCNAVDDFDVSEEDVALAASVPL